MKYLTILFLISVFYSVVSAQPDYNSKIVTDTIPINFQNLYSISDVSIIPFTETIRIGSRVLEKKDYTFSYQDGTFSLSDTLQYAAFDTLIVTYMSYKTGLQKEYKKRSLVIRYDEEKKDTLRESVAEISPLSTESIFGSGMEKSGTLIRGFTVGTTKDFSLQSGLRLQLSGRLSEDLEIVAALTDENTPIQPEGNTERLEELDKVFIQVKHPNAAGTFGDYQLQKKYGEFGFIDRKLQGLLGEFQFQDNSISSPNKYSGYVSLAGSRGKFNSNYFTGIDGVQGPYRLTGINNERDIIIIAGTERVYIDGVEMRRGEANDYVIEYSIAEITFSTRRLITAASRITVDFEYTDRRYTRNFFGAGSAGSFFSDNLSIAVQYMREGDDQNAPIDNSLNEEDKQILKTAGDSQSNAVKSGISIAPPDSSGIIRGAYSKRDTLINDEPFSYYIYNPGDTSAIYNISFSFVGDGAGDYIRESLGNFRFVGIREGEYLPLIFLPLPEMRQAGNIVMNLTPWKDVTLNMEFAGSIWDRNRFSPANDNDNAGYARNILFQINPVDVNIGSLNFGKAGVIYRDRFIQDRYVSLDRINPIEFDRYYNINSAIQEDEQLRELNVSLIPVEQLKLTSMVGLLRRGDTFKSNRYNNNMVYTDSSINLNYNLDYVESDNVLIKSYWLRQRGLGSYTFGLITPGLEFLAEDKKDKSANDSIVAGSLRYYEVNPFVSLNRIFGINISARLSFREDYSPVLGNLIKDSRSIAQFFELVYSGEREFSTLFNLTLRNRKYTEEYKALQPQSAIDDETILVRSQSRFNFIKPITGDLFYEVSTLRSAKLQRVFIPVEQGAGNYIYVGDLNNNGIQDEYEFEPAIYDGNYILVTLPTDELFPVIDLQTSTRWKINYGDFFDKTSIMGEIIRPLSTETVWRIEENTREQDYKKIYLLQLSAFQNDTNTIRGSNYFQNDIFLWENDQELSFRFRYSQRKSLNQFSDGVERGYSRERSARIRFKLVKEIGNQTDLVNETDNVGANVASNRRREITGNSFSTDFSYRPQNNIEIGFRVRVERKEDDFPSNPTIIDINSLLLRLNLSFEGRGRLRAELERNELTSNTLENFLPFELTDGNLIGKNYFWRINFDYRLSANLQSTLSYDGRLQGAGRAINTLRAEVRAYF